MVAKLKNSKTQIVIKLKKTQIVIKLNNSKCQKKNSIYD